MGKIVKTHIIYNCIYILTGVEDKLMLAELAVTVAKKIQCKEPLPLHNCTGQYNVLIQGNELHTLRKYIPLSTVFQPLYKAVWRTRSIEITPGNTSVVGSPLLVDILDAASTDTGVEEGPAGCGPSATHTTYVS